MTGVIAVIAAVLLLIVLILIADALTPKKSGVVFSAESFREDKLCEACRQAINEVLNSDFQELNLNMEETVKREQQQARLRKATRQACLGDTGDREYIKEYIKELLEKKLGVNEVTINYCIPFDNTALMSAQDKFEYLYVLYAKKYAGGIFKYMCIDFDWLLPKYDEANRCIFSITDADIDAAYAGYPMCGNYNDRLDTLVQRCYQKLYGHDCTDLLIMDESLDGISAGVGGKTRVEYNYLEELRDISPENQSFSRGYDTVYCVIHGKLIRLKFLSFGNSQNLERVVKNIYRYNTRTTLSQKNPVLHGTFKNGSRIVVARPPVSDGWVFYVRKFMSSNAKKIESLLIHRKSDIVIQLLKHITGGELNFVISGPMGGGKTTLLKALVSFMNPQYSIRVAESSFELNINNVYPERNIHVLQARGDYSIYDIITGTKKMDTDILIVGEVNEPKIAGAYIQVAQSGSRMAVTTLHHETTQKLIEYLRNALVTEFGINNVEVAEKQVVDILNFDVHMVHDVEGNFYIERITEIIPEEMADYPKDLEPATREYYRRKTDRKSYKLVNIVEFDKNTMSYSIKNNISKAAYNKIAERIGKGSADDIYELLTGEIGGASD